MTGADPRPEILRLARLLRIDPEELAFLDAVGDQDLRLFRNQVTDALFDAHTGMLARLGAAAKLIPAPVTARIAQAVFGPLLCARIAGTIEPRKASDLAKRLPVRFLTDVAIELDPRRSQAIIGQVPTDTVVAVAVELVGRRDWLTLGRFVGHVDDAALGACLSAIDDVELLNTAHAVDDISAIPAVIDLLPEGRLASLLATASREELWPVLLGIAGHLRDDQIVDLAGVLAGGDGDGLLDELVDAAAAHMLWDNLLPLAASLPIHAQQAVADTARQLTPQSRAEVVAHADALGIAGSLGPIIDAVTEQVA